MTGSVLPTMNIKVTILAIIVLGSALCLMFNMLELRVLEDNLWTKKEQRVASSKSSSLLAWPSSQSSAFPTSLLPTVIIHMGPQKTATTSIQAWLRALSKEYLLPHDKTVFRGYTEDAYLAGSDRYLRSVAPVMCLARMFDSGSYDETRQEWTTYPVCENNKTVGDAFQKWTQSIHEDFTLHGRNTIFSEEAIPRLQSLYHRYNHLQQDREAAGSNSSREAPRIYPVYQYPKERDRIVKYVSTLHMLRDQVFPDYHTNKGSIQVVATYRRYFDWLHSEYQQEMKVRTMFHFVNLPILGFVEWYRLYKEIQELEVAGEYYQVEHSGRRYHGMPYHVIRPLLPADIAEWEQVFGSPVRIFNMHEIPATSTAQSEPLPLPLRWLCEMASNITNYTCQQAYSGNLKTHISEHRNRFDQAYRARRIDRHARKSGLLQFSPAAQLELRNVNLQRKVWQLIQDFLDEQQSVPMTCLSDKELKEVYDKSVEFQQAIVPAYHSDGLGQTDIDETWDQATKSQMFCDVDISKLFEQQPWKDFFVELGNKF